MRDLTPCPCCGQPTDLTAANKYRPFCSERCRTIDLGGWLNEEHRIAGDGLGEPPADDEAQPADARQPHARH